MSKIENQESTHSHNKGSFFSRLMLWVSEPHPMVQDIGDRRRAQLLAGISLLLVLPLLLGVFVRGYTRPPSEHMSAESFQLVGLVLFSLLAYILSRTPYFRWGSTVLVTAFSITAISNALIDNTVSGALFFLIPAFVIGSALLGIVGISILVIINVPIVFLLPILSPLVEPSYAESGIIFTTGLLLILVVAVRNLIERERLAEVKNVNQELRSLQATLEQRVADATRNLELAAEISRRVSMVGDVDTMLSEAVETIRERFNLYYTQIFLTDTTGKILVLRAGTGDVGRTLLNRVHRLPIDMGSLNGIAVTERRPVIVEDTAANPLHRANPLLPDTRSEMVVPLLVGKRIIGVLDMQSSTPDALSSENLSAFEALAGQLAISVTNAELFAEAEQAQALVAAQARRMTQQGWKDFMDGIERSERLAYTYDRQKITSLKTPITDVQDKDALLTPIQITGVDLGKMQFQREEAWTEDDIAASNAVAQQVAQQIENLRLLAQSEQYQSEAQETLKRLTREGWQTYQDQFGKDYGYIYQDHQVKSLAGGSSDFKEAITYEIKVQDEPIGEVAFPGMDTLSEDDEELISFVNQQLSTHLENLRLSSQTEKALTETEAMLEITSTASSSLDLDRTSSQVLSKVLDITDASSGLISIFNRKNKKLEITSHDLPEVMFQNLQTNGLEGTLCDLVYQRKETLLLKDLNQETPIDVTGLVTLGFKAYQGVPLTSKGAIYGTLCIFYPEIIQNQETDTALLEVVGQQIGIAIENAHLFEQAQQQAQREQILRRITAAVRSSTDPTTIMRTAVQELGNALGRKTSIRMRDSTSILADDNGS